MSSNNQLKAFVERLEKLEAEKAALSEDIKEVMLEAKSSGFDPRIIKKVLSLRKVNAQKRAEEQAILAVYMDALGMLADTPLGIAAVDEAKRVSSRAVEIDEDDDESF